MWPILQEKKKQSINRFYHHHYYMVLSYLYILKCMISICILLTNGYYGIEHFKLLRKFPCIPFQPMPGLLEVITVLIFFTLVFTSLVSSFLLLNRLLFSNLLYKCNSMFSFLTMVNKVGMNMPIQVFFVNKCFYFSRIKT